VNSLINKLQVARENISAQNISISFKLTGVTLPVTLLEIQKHVLQTHCLITYGPPTIDYTYHVTC